MFAKGGMRNRQDRGGTSGYVPGLPGRLKGQQTGIVCALNQNVILSVRNAAGVANLPIWYEFWKDLANRIVRPIQCHCSSPTLDYRAPGIKERGSSRYFRKVGNFCRERLRARGGRDDPAAIGPGNARCLEPNLNWEERR
jgi:hypothetical protein